MIDENGFHKENHIRDKVIVVTGAANGFGRLICKKASLLGAKIMAADINEKKLLELVSDINKQGGAVQGIKTDVCYQDQMHDLAQKAISDFGSIDVMINNAGVMPMAFYADHSIASDAWDRCIDINFKGVLHGINASYDQMIKQGRGHVVNLASIVANAPAAGCAVYGATKAAVVFLSEGLRVESQGKIKVTIVRPTGVPNTGLNDTVINPESGIGVFGQNFEKTKEKHLALASGQHPSGWTDKNSIEYFALDAESLVDQVINAINQPWGLLISDITVRASGESFVI